MSSTKSRVTKPTVCIVESLGFFDEDARKEGEIISRTLRLSEKEAHYSYLRTREELQALLEEFGSSSHRYLHLSCHGNAGEFYLTTEMVPALEFVEMLMPHMNGRRLFLSSCLVTDSKFAKRLIEEGDCLSVLGPADSIRFDDAAIFWSSFYHQIFKIDANAMKRAAIQNVVSKSAHIVGERFRFFYKKGGRVRQALIGPRP